MRSIVCIKRVPDSEARLRVAADGLAIDSAGVKFSMNPYDEFALEEALRLKEKFGEGSVTAVTVGPDAARETLQRPGLLPAVIAASIPVLAVGFLFRGWFETAARRPELIASTSIGTWPTDWHASSRYGTPTSAASWPMATAGFTSPECVGT